MDIVNQQLTDVYNDTVNKLKNTKAIGTTVLYSYEHLPFNFIGKNTFETEIVVEPKDTISCVLDLNGQGVTAMLNMASNRVPGGGVKFGARAQEESLFRCTDLFKTISNEHYPLDFNQGLYTSNTLIIKDRQYNLLDVPVFVDTITIPAINMNKFTLSDKKYIEITEKKIDFILNLAASYRVDNLVLGAWGCGVYKNNPEFISKTFKKTIEEKGYPIKKIVFGVINDKNSVGSNYQIFKDTLCY